MQITEPHDGGKRRMSVLVQRSDRGPNDMQYATDYPRPVAGPGEYLIRVGAAGMNFADVMQTRGIYGGGPRPPYVAGFEAAGEIVAVGPKVAAGLPLGSHVVGTGPGAYAQYMTMPAAQAVPVPSGWTDAQALGLVLNWATALAALKPIGQIEAGETVLVHAGAGGVGQAAVRLARHYGARVIATASPFKHDIVKACGAEAVLDRAAGDLADQILRLSGGVDLVLESVGRATLPISLAVTKPFSGRIVVFGAASGDATLTTKELVFSHQVQVKGLHIGALASAVPSVYRALLDEIDALIAQGVYRPGTPQIHSLAEGPGVLRELEAGRTHGKHAIDPWL